MRYLRFGSSVKKSAARKGKSAGLTSFDLRVLGRWKREFVLNTSRRKLELEES